MPIYLPTAHIQSPSHCQMEMRPRVQYHSHPQKCYSVPHSQHDKQSFIVEDCMIDEGASALRSLCFTPGYDHLCGICSVGMRLGSICCATSCSTYSTIHNVGLMKLMGQNTVSILQGTKHLTGLLGLCPATVTHQTNPADLLMRHTLCLLAPILAFQLLIQYIFAKMWPADFDIRTFIFNPAAGQEPIDTGQTGVPQAALK